MRMGQFGRQHFWLRIDPRVGRDLVYHYQARLPASAVSARQAPAQSLVYITLLPFYAVVIVDIWLYFVAEIAHS